MLVGAGVETCVDKGLETEVCTAAVLSVDEPAGLLVGEHPVSTKKGTIMMAAKGHRYHFLWLYT